MVPKSHDLRMAAATDAPDANYARKPASVARPRLHRGFTSARIAIVHDFLYTYAGAERVLEQMIEVFPNADLFSLFDFLPKGERGFLKNKSVKTTFLQRMPFARRKHRAYLPLMPLAIEQLDVSAYDLIISSSYLAAKGVLTRPAQLHVCYCHSPVRFAWDLQNRYLGQTGLRTGIKSALARMLLHYVRMWDVRTSNGVDVFLTNSRFVGRRVEKTYRRESLVVYPPVAIDKFTPCSAKEDYFLTVSRMVPYKRMDMVVEAFARMPQHRLVVIGDGPEMGRIRAKVAPNVKLMGHLPFAQVLHHMQRAKAFIFAAEEDFGIVAVEAQACGTPVIALGEGGVTESVIPGITGLFFNEQTAESLMKAVAEFEQLGPWDPQIIRENSENFAPSRFREEFSSVVRCEWEKFERSQAQHWRSMQGPIEPEGAILNALRHPVEVDPALVPGQTRAVQIG